MSFNDWILSINFDNYTVYMFIFVYAFGTFCFLVQMITLIKKKKAGYGIRMRPSGIRRPRYPYYDLIDPNITTLNEKNTLNVWLLIEIFGLIIFFALLVRELYQLI